MASVQSERSARHYLLLLVQAAEDVQRAADEAAFPPDAASAGANVSQAKQLSLSCVLVRQAQCVCLRVMKHSLLIGSLRVAGNGVKAPPEGEAKVMSLTSEGQGGSLNASFRQ